MRKGWIEGVWLHLTLFSIPLEIPVVSALCPVPCLPWPRGHPHSKNLFVFLPLAAGIQLLAVTLKKKKKGKLSNPHSAILRRHITYVYHHISSYSLSPSLGYFCPQKKPKQRSPRYSAVNRQDSNFPEQLWDTKDSHNGLNKGMLQEPLNKHIK